MTIMFDTSMCIHVIRRKPSEILERIRNTPRGSLVVPTIVMAELQCGVIKSANPHKNQRALAKFLQPFSLAAFTPQDAIVYGRLRAGLERRGCPIGPLDTLIAAAAVARESTLVTANDGEFRRVPDLKVENWLDAV